MAKQTFTTGQVLTAAQMTSLQQTAMGGGSATAKTASYTLVAADAGTTVIMNSGSATTITVNTGLFAAGDTVFIVNQGAGVCTITAGTATVSTAGSLAMGANETGQLYFLSASAAIFSEYTQSAAAGGKVLQVIMGEYSTPTVTVSSTTFTDTGMSASITPSSATSKVLVLTSQPFYMYKSGAEMAIGLRVRRGATTIADLSGGGDSGWYMNTTNGSRADMQGRVAFNYLDSPATTSATTYTMQGNTYGSGSVAFSNGSTPATIILMEIGA
jgi:hypothetical protein